MSTAAPVRPAAPPGRGLRLGRVLGVPVLLQPSWFLFAAITVFAYGPLLGDGPYDGYLAAGSFAALLLASVLLHEIGHCVVARRFGLPVRSITVSFLAGATEITDPPQTPLREFAVAVAGPLVSLLLGAVGLVGALALPVGTARTLFVLLAVSNGLVGVFNLLPGLPLDGGRVLRAAVWRLTGDPDRATVVSAQAGRVVGLVVVPLALFGAVPLLGGRVTLVGAAFALLLGAFIYGGATASLKAARLSRRLPAVTVARLARPALSVPGDLPLAETLRRTAERGLHAIVVVDGAGRPDAVVSEAAVLDVPPARRPWVPVSSVARRLEAGLLLEPALAGEALLAAMRATPGSEYVIRDPAGDPPRVLVAADIARAVGAAAR